MIIAPILFWDQLVFLASFVFELQLHLEVCINVPNDSG
jgi:hypothetical protein